MSGDITRSAWPNKFARLIAFLVCSAMELWARQFRSFMRILVEDDCFALPQRVIWRKVGRKTGQYILGWHSIALIGIVPGGSGGNHVACVDQGCRTDLRRSLDALRISSSARRDVMCCGGRSEVEIPARAACLRPVKCQYVSPSTPRSITFLH